MGQQRAGARVSGEPTHNKPERATSGADRVGVADPKVRDGQEHEGDCRCIERKRQKIWRMTRRRRTRQEEEDHRERDRRAQRAEEHDESEAVTSIRLQRRNSGRGGNARRQTYMNQPQRKNDTPDASIFAGDCPS